MLKKLAIYKIKNKEHLESARKLIDAAKKAGKAGEAFVKIANAVLDVAYFQENHVPDKYRGMDVSAYLYWLFLAELNHAFFDDGDVTFVSACENGEIRFALLLFEHKSDVQKRIQDPDFVLNKRIASEVETFNARSEIWKRCGSQNEPIISNRDYQINIHTNPHLFCEEFVMFASREML